MVPDIFLEKKALFSVLKSRTSGVGTSVGSWTPWTWSSCARARSLGTTRVAASLGIASRAAEKLVTSPLPKEAGIWPVALEMLPAAVSGAVLLIISLDVGVREQFLRAVSCFSGVTLLTESERSSFALGLCFRYGHP